MADHFSTKDLETVEAINEVAEKYDVRGADVLEAANRIAEYQKEDLAGEYSAKSDALTPDQIIDRAGQEVADVYEKENKALKEGLSEHAYELHADSYRYEQLEYGKEPAGKEIESSAVQGRDREMER